MPDFVISSALLFVIITGFLTLSRNERQTLLEGRRGDTADRIIESQKAKAIDAMFANSTAETSTDTEKAFGKAFAAQFGNIALIVLLVVGAAFSPS